MITTIKIIFKIFAGIELRGGELKSVIGLAASRNKQRIFEYLLKKFDPALDLSYCQDFPNKSFLNEGRGLGTLKPYRMLENGDTKVFEKIFFNYSKNLASAVYFDRHQEKLLADKAIKAPRLRDTIKGKNLTILLYEFWNLEKLPEDSAYPVLKSKTMELCRDLTSVREKPGYINPATGKKKIYNPKRDLFVQEFVKIERIAQTFPVYFQHLDLGEENVFANDVIIDWDNSGYYNLGVDFGRLLLSHYILNQDVFLATYKAEVSDYHLKSNSGVPFDEFYPVVLFYFLILFHGHHATEDSVDQIGRVIEDFKGGRFVC